MIDTEIATDNSPSSLQMYSFNGQQLIDRFHNKMVNYLQTNKKILADGVFKEKLSVSRDFNNLLIGTYNADNTGIKPSNIIKQGNRSTSEFATHILQLYVDYLQREEEKQAKMNFKQIDNLLSSNKVSTMFSAQAYIDWIMDNLTALDGPWINISYIIKLKASNYFLKSLIVKLTKTNGINSVVISEVIRNLVQIYSNAVLPPELLVLCKQLQSFFADPKILHQKFTNLAKMNYYELLILFKLAGITAIKLPLIAALNISKNMRYYEGQRQNADYVEYYVLSENELQDFMNYYINEYKSWMPKFTKDILKSKIIFHFKDYQNIINNQINAIRNSFYHVEKLTELADILSLLLKCSAYQKIPNS